MDEEEALDLLRQAAVGAELGDDPEESDPDTPLHRVSTGFPPGFRELLSVWQPR
jgi:hypothetical protein